MITDRRKFATKLTLSCTLRLGNVPTQIFRKRPMLDIAYYNQLIVRRSAGAAWRLIYGGKEH